MKSFMAINVVVLLGIFIPTQGIADIPKSLPIGSRAQLRAYAISQSTGGWLGVSGESIVGNSHSTTDVQINPTNGNLSLDTVLKMLCCAEFDFEITDPDKEIHATGGIYNKNWDVLFWGNGYVPLNKNDNDGFVFESVNLTFKMADLVPIEVGETIIRAYVETTEEWISLEVIEGRIYFPSNLCSKDGKLSLFSKDQNGWRELVYSLESGKRLPTYEVEGSFYPVVPDHFVYSDLNYPLPEGSNLGVCITGSIDEGAEAPVATIKLSKKRNVLFSARIIDNETGKIVENPTAGWVFRKDSDIEEKVILVPGSWSSPKTLWPGEYIFYPETDLYDDIPRQDVEIGKG